MMSSLSVLVLASCLCLCLCLTSSWVDICDYQDSYGSTCCSPSMEHSQYYVVPFSEPWEFQQNICHARDKTGHLVILEDMAEWACVSHYIDDYYQHSARKYAIGLRSEEHYEGIYRWQYRDGDPEIPDSSVWASSHPRNEPCVSMEIGTGADRNGAWLDGDCMEENLFAFCERKKH